MIRLTKFAWLVLTLKPVRRYLRQMYLFRIVRFSLLSAVALGLTVAIAVLVRQLVSQLRAGRSDGLSRPADRELARPAAAPPATTPPAKTPPVKTPPVQTPPASPPKTDLASTDPLNGMCPESHPVKGITRSGIYHDASSRWYEKAKADICFRDGAAAEEAGFRPPGKKSS